MEGKILGGYVKKCAEGKKWATSATLFVQTDFPSDAQECVGGCVRSIVCEGKFLPAPLKDMYGHKYHISTNNNFASDFFRIE